MQAISTNSPMKLVQLGLKLGGDPPNMMPCLEHVARFGQSSLKSKKCSFPGVEIDFMELLLESLNSTYSAAWYPDNNHVATAIRKRQMDIFVKVGRPASMIKKKRFANMTYSNSVWSKQYCYAFKRPKNAQFLAKFSPFGPFRPTSWITIFATFLVCSVIARLGHGSHDSAWSHFERMLVQTNPVSPRLSYKMIYIVAIGTLGITHAIYSSLVASQLVSEPIPPELATVDTFLSFAKNGNYKLYSDDAHRLHYLKSKFFVGSNMIPVYEFFKSNTIGKLPDDSVGYKILMSKKVDIPNLDIMTFMMPVNVHKGKYVTNRYREARLICILGNHHFLESLPMLKERPRNELVNRQIEKLNAHGLIVQLQSTYTGLAMSSSYDLSVSPDALQVGVLHYETSSELFFALYLVAGIICLIEVGHYKIQNSNYYMRY